MKSLPLSITLALFISLFTATTLVPLLSYTYIKFGIKNDSHKGRKAAFMEGLQSFYDKLVEKTFTRKKLIVAIGASSFVLGLIILVITPQQPFPKIERNQFAVEVYLPEGSSLQQTDAVLKDLEQLLQKDSRIQVVTSFVGTSSPRFHTLYAPNFPAKNYGQLIVLTTSSQATADILDQYSVKYADRYPRAELKWKQLEICRFKTPIEVRISGDDIEPLKRVANQVEDILRHTEGTLLVRSDYKQPLQTIDLDIKKDEASRLGYSNALLGYSLMAGTKGFPVATIWEEDYPVDVKLKIDKKTKSNVDDVNNQYVTSPFLVASVPLRQLADLKPGWTEGEIVRRNGVRTLTVQADIKRGIYTSGILNKAKPQIDKLQLPEGVRIEYDGEYADNIDFMTPMYWALATSIAIIFLILMGQFRNIRTSLLIMLTMPLSIFGAALGVFIAGYPFSQTAFIGLIGLMGIVVRNGIIYVSYAEELRTEHGHSLEEAAIAAAKRRMRPIFLTAAAAAVAVIPMILSGSSLWGPMAAVICFGLIFGLVLSLLVMPVLYYYFHKNDFIKGEENGTI
ncbi:MAG: efflux RND transporter permease subunit [Smithellaceae bacterium]